MPFPARVDLGDDRVLFLGRKHGQVGRDSGPLRPAKDVPVRIGVDDDDRRPLSARMVAKMVAAVVLPTPPLGELIAIMGICLSLGARKARRRAT